MSAWVVGREEEEARKEGLGRPFCEPINPVINRKIKIIITGEKKSLSFSTLTI